MQSAVEKLRKYRDENYRSHDEIVDLWTEILFRRNLSSLGDEKWLILEQVFKSALHCSKQAIARECLEQLEKQFKITSRRVQTLNAMYFESIGEFERAEDIYSTLLEDNETDAIVRKRQISLLKEQNQIREAISELNSYLELYQADQEAWSELCDLYLSEHDYIKAAFCAEELLLINPHNHLNHERYASIRYSQGDYEKARTYYFSTLKIAPANIRALYGILLTSTNLAIKTTTTSKTQNSNENNHLFLEQIQWVREQILQKYREMIPDLLPIVESAIQSLTI
jgi:tetratricopeptide (TPR) repeat protein